MLSRARSLRDGSLRSVCEWFNTVSLILNLSVKSRYISNTDLYKSIPPLKWECVGKCGFGRFKRIMSDFVVDKSVVKSIAKPSSVYAYVLSAICSCMSS